jgi:hypothetical protein
MGQATKWIDRSSFLLLAVAAGISICWGIALERGARLGVMGFPGIYFGTRCLVQGGDPYDLNQLRSIYSTAGFTDSSSAALRQSVSLYVNLPTTFLFVAPFAWLPLAAAQTIWLILLVSSFLLAAFLVWRIAAVQAPSVALLLMFIVLANCEIIFSGGNTAGLVVSLCVIAVWCLLRDRFIAAGVVCLAVSFAIKPHDVGLVWLYFLLAGRIQRMRALKALALSVVLALAAALWVTHVAPHWLPELRSNLAEISGHGGINEPGPTSIGVNSPDMIIDLQTVVSIFVNEPNVYNPITYSVCGLLLFGWLVAVLRFSPSRQNAWFALVSVAALSMLVTYHRSYDAKLLLLAVPACAMLWAEGGPTAWIALLLSTAGVLSTSDIPLAILMRVTRNLYSPDANLAGKSFVSAVTRPAPLCLLAIAIFFLLVYVRRSRQNAENGNLPGTMLS